MDRPNLVIIHTDQQNSWTIGAYGGELVETPNIDRIAREGAMFTDFFTNSAICTPSRGCFVTGRYPHAHGAFFNNLELNPDEITFAQILLERGYETGYAGKWHLDGTPRPGWVHPGRSTGFRDCRFMFNRGHWQRIEDARMGDMQPKVFEYRFIGDEKTYATDWLADKTIAFIERERSAPFCYMVSIPDPHAPWSVRKPYDEMFDPREMPVPPTFSEESLPDWAEEVRAHSIYALDRPDRCGRLRSNKAVYCAMVKLIDDSVGRILARLEELGILDETVVVFTTDHGDYMGEHGLSEKNHLYESVYRIPLLVRWPGAIEAGTVVERFVTTVDFQQTILGLMGVEPCGREQGRDGSSLLRGDEIEWKDEAHLYHSRHGRPARRYHDGAGIITPHFELGLMQDGDPILFDRRADPNQTDNLAGDPSHKEVFCELLARVVRHHEELGSPAAEWLKGIA